VADQRTEVAEERAAELSEAVRRGGDPHRLAAMLAELADLLDDLDRPLETITALERLTELEPEVLSNHDRLARLYHRAGAWFKAAEAFERVARLTRDDKGRAALRAATRLYVDHGRPERAITAYHALVERYPADREAWRALDRLLGEQGRWGELADVRGALAARTTGLERAALLRAQARALDEAGDAAAAAGLVVEASELAPEDISGAVDYAEVLARDGRGREAADLLAARIAASAGAAPETVAALRLRMARVLVDECGDRAGAIAALEELLAGDPRHVPALEYLAALAARSGDPAAHAAAVLRYAGALDDAPARGAVLAEAARVFRAAGDHAAAVAAYDEACALAPNDGVVAAERDAARAAVAVERARAQAKAGDPDGAERQLAAVLAARPDDLEANLARAELLADAGRIADAAAHLRATLDAAEATAAAAAASVAPDGSSPGRPRGATDTARGELRARVLHRYAVVVAALGEPDRAHQLLHEAHRSDRRSLPITLALGDSSFGRRLWREAALHLGSLADHPDAPEHAAAVGAALVRAAQAEIRGLRPANAEKHYAAAVRIDPGCATAWHALAELTTERGDIEGAAAYLEREAAATVEPAGRLRLFDALGDLALGVLGDAARAERCWRQVAADAPAPVLGKLLALQRRRGAGAERGETCVRLAALESDPRAKKELIEEATEAFAAGGDVIHAQTFAAALVASHPLDIDAVACATTVSQAAGDHARTIAWLEPALAAWDAGDRESAGSRTAPTSERAGRPAGEAGSTSGRAPAPADPRRAELWRRLADALVAEGDPGGARAAYERAIAIAPDSDGALASHRGMVDMAVGTDEAVPGAFAALVAAEHAPADVVAWARECARAGDAAAADALFGLARALGVELHAGDERVLAAQPRRAMASDQAYAVVLAEAERRALVDDEADAPLAGVLETLAEAAPLLSPPRNEVLARAGFTGAERLSATSHVAAAALYPRIADALGGPTALLHASSHRASADLTVLLGAPPVIVLGPRLIAQRPRSVSELTADLDDGELRFVLGRAIELARPARVFAAAAGGRDGLARLIRGLVHALVRPESDPGDAAVAAESARLRQALPLLLRRKLADQLAALDLTALDAARFHAACERAADRSGLLASGDVAIAIRRAGGPSAARHLVELAASPAFHAAHRRLRF
jgi:tetratricopeptide (TPR) repeat protein